MINASELPLPPMTRRWFSNCPINPIILNQESQSPLLNLQSVTTIPQIWWADKMVRSVLGPVIERVIIAARKFINCNASQLWINPNSFHLCKDEPRMNSAFGIQDWEPIWVTSELRDYITTCINHNFITFIIFQFIGFTRHMYIVHSLTEWVKRFEPTKFNSSKVFFALNLFLFFPVCGQRTHVCTRRALRRNNGTFWSNVELFLCRYLEEREPKSMCLVKCETDRPNKNSWWNVISIVKSNCPVKWQQYLC